MPSSSVDSIVVENLRAALDQSGRSAYSVATALGRAPNWLYQVLNKKNGILLPTLREVADELGVSLGSLVDPPRTVEDGLSVGESVPGKDHQDLTAGMMGERLAEARRRAGLSQIELAAALGEHFDQPMISQVEAGRGLLRSDCMVSAAKELQVSTDYLLGITDDPTPAVDLERRVLSLLENQLPGERIRGTTPIADGILYFFDGDPPTQNAIIIDIKLTSEATTGIYELKSALKHFNASMGLLVTRNDTNPAPKDLVDRAGTFHSITRGKDFPRIQVRTIGELLTGNGFDLPVPFVEDQRTLAVIPLDNRPSGLEMAKPEI